MKQYHSSEFNVFFKEKNSDFILVHLVQSLLITNVETKSKVDLNIFRMKQTIISSGFIILINKEKSPAIS